MNKKIKDLLKETIGIIFSSFGVAGVVFTGLGSSPIDAATYYMNKLLPIGNDGQGQGIWLIMFNVIIAIFLLIALKNKKILFAIVVSIATGLFFEVALSSYQKMFNISGIMSTNDSIFLRIILAVFFLNMMSFGIGYLAQNKLYGTPYDELTIFVQKKVNKYFISKIILDGSFLLIAIILGLIYQDVFKQIGLFTIVILGVLGPLINFYINLLNKYRKED